MPALIGVLLGIALFRDQLIMSNFIDLRIILQEAKPSLASFLAKLNENKLPKEDLDILLRKTIESKIAQFEEFADVLVRYPSSL